ncbi:AI-2E family transporter [Nannocystis sp. RBIL2]|uniref:AI-2E family transporter n=1 Tax=Nannocystis sp. RBIL2 TaxID=2996788 RepID=UPI002271503E|nr:AI-2E family transporter [Nannocystis sp. RBIL2]MCY1071341.1 AI-2E family transporter [Nannocystis sp. RBIL2]
MNDDETDAVRREQARRLILLATVVGAFYLCWLMLEPFVDVLLWAGVLTLTFEPVHRRILARVRRPDLSAGLSTLFVIVVIGAPMSLVTWAIAREIAPAVGMLQTVFGQLLDPDSELTGPAMRWLGRHVDLVQIRHQISEQLRALGMQLANRTIGVLGNVLGLFIRALFVVFVTYYLFRDGRMVRDAMASAIPLHDRQTREILRRIGEVVGASVHGVLVIATLQGVLGGLAFAVLGVPSAIVWGVAMVFLSLIPLAGAFVVWIPAAIYLVVSGAWIKGILLALWGVLVISLVDNFLRPRLVGKRAKLHELFIFFAVLGGLQVFGLIGLVLGPVVLAIALSLFEAFRHPGDAAAAPPPEPAPLQ